MVLFFDLCVPCLEQDGASAAENKARKDARLRCVVKAMELGYVGVAYERCFKGILSERDRCKIQPFPLSSLLAAAPVLRSSVAFHRGLLGTPASAPFRQYTRLTILVDDAVSSVSLMSRNPLIRSYDIVAARPLNQVAFEHACQAAEVDIISIDFSQKLPFRMKPPLIEAAIKRGLYFEITYSELIFDVDKRRQMLSEAKLLVDWARGRNIIVSSAASNVNELRGPCDVINLSVFLLGFSTERAKAAISNNCRSLVTDALRKKHCYKEAIRIERIPDECVDHKSIWFGNWHDWDPISSGLGDLSPLDDFPSLSAANSIPTRSTAVNSESVVTEVQLKNSLSRVERDMLNLGGDSSNLNLPEKPSLSDTANEVPSAANDESTQQGTRDFSSSAGRILMDTGPLEPLTSSFEHASLEQTEMASSTSDAVEPVLSVGSKDQIAATEGNMTSPETLMHHIGYENMELSDAIMENNESSDDPNAILLTDKNQNGIMELGHDIPSRDTNHNLPNDILRIVDDDLLKKPVEAKIEEQVQKDSNQGIRLVKFVQEPEVVESAVSLADNVLLGDASKKVNEPRNEVPVPLAEDAVLKGILVKLVDQEQDLCSSNASQKICRSKSGKRKHNKPKLYPAFPLPFKTLSKPMFFRKNVSQLRRLRKHL